MAEDWRTRYVILRGACSVRPMLHRWRPGPPYDAVNSWCGMAFDHHSMVLDTNVADTVPRCRRCWR